MKLLSEYLERAVSLERLAASEQDSDFKTQLLNQAAAYRKLAARRAEQYWMPAPSPPEMPPPPRNGGPPVTNIRNTSSPHWRGWLRPESRCLVPFNSFAEYAPEPSPATKKKDVVWFALNNDRPLTAFAGVWTTFDGDRGTKSKPVPGPHQVYGFLTTSPNAVVEPIHPKAMPVIVTTDEERDGAHHGMRRRRCNGRCQMIC
jgi:putative SOS response-associated peptidase YedK